MSASPGLQGFIANPNIDNPDKNDFLNWDARVQSAMAAMLLTGGGHAIGKVRELLGSKGRKIFNGTDFKTDPFHTADAEKTLSSSMGFAGGKGKKPNKGNQGDLYEQYLKEEAAKKRVLEPPKFKQTGAFKEHVHLSDRPLDLPGNLFSQLQPPYPKQYYGKSWDVQIPKSAVNQGGKKEIFDPYVREGLTGEGQHYLMGKKIKDQIEERGWDMKKIQNLLDYGKRLKGTEDLRYNHRKTSEFLTDQGEAVTMIAEDGYSMTFNEITHEILQIDNRNKLPKF